MRNAVDSFSFCAYGEGMEAMQNPGYRICQKRNVAAAFEHFHSRPSWLRPASLAYCEAWDVLGRFARSASSACSSIGLTRWASKPASSARCASSGNP
jgi:hypothetical protein